MISKKSVWLKIFWAIFVLFIVAFAAFVSVGFLDYNDSIEISYVDGVAPLATILATSTTILALLVFLSGIVLLVDGVFTLSKSQGDQERRGAGKYIIKIALFYILVALLLVLFWNFYLIDRLFYVPNQAI